MKVGEVAKILNISRHIAQMRTVRLPGGRYWIPESEVRRILESGGDKGRTRFR
ncbi:MAG: hypothetical protein ACTSXJ_03815 [Candidatus Baldrarchaeia archaeon]